MFVQGPQIIRQRSDNSDDVSDEEGPEDALQVDPPRRSWLDIFALSMTRRIVFKMKNTIEKCCGFEGFAKLFQ